MSHTSDFAEKPLAFLADKLVVVPETTDAAVGSPKVFRFVLKSAGDRVFTLEPAEDDASEAIVAHYLPWKAGEAASMDLDESAGFFFTSEMTNCRFTVFPNAGRHPKVAHIAGTLSKTERNVKEKEVFGEGTRVRRLSISGSVGIGAHGYRGQVDGKPGLSSSAFVFGQRGADGWTFVAQVVKGVMTARPHLLDDVSHLSFVDILAHRKTDKLAGMA